MQKLYYYIFEPQQIVNFIKKTLLNDDYEFMMFSNRHLIVSNIPLNDITHMLARMHFFLSCELLEVIHKSSIQKMIDSWSSDFWNDFPWNGWIIYDHKLKWNERMKIITIFRILTNRMEWVHLQLKICSQ